MSCIWNIPREERHCEYCLVSCGEREMQYTTSATNTSTIVPIPNNTIVSGGEVFFVDGKFIHCMCPKWKGGEQ